MIAVPYRRRRLPSGRTTGGQGGERLQQGAVTLAALTALAAIWLGIGLPSLPSVFAHHGRSVNETPLVAYTEDSSQPRPHAAPAIPVRRPTAAPRHMHKRASRFVRSTSATGSPTWPSTPAATSRPSVVPTGAVQTRVEAAAPNRTTAPGPASVTAAESAVAPAAAATATTPATATAKTGTDTPTPPPPPAPPVTLPSLPNVPDLPGVTDLPVPNVPALPTLPPTPSVTVPQTPPPPPLPAVEPPQLPPVQAPTQAPSLP